MQRRTFIELRSKGADDGLITRSFCWFGSYLLWTPHKGYSWHLKVAWIDPESGQAMLLAEEDPDSGEASKPDVSSIEGRVTTPEDAPVVLKDIGQDQAEACTSNQAGEHGMPGERGAENTKLPFDANRGEGADVIMRCQVFVSHMRGRTLGLVNPRLSPIPIDTVSEKESEVLPDSVEILT